MIKCEMHLHIAGTSPCAKTAPEDIAKAYHEAGYGAIAVTNHYMKYLFEEYYPGKTEESKIRFYINSYRSLKKACKPYGIKVFLGMELNPECVNTPEVRPAAEILCYGVTEKFLLSHMRLYNYTQKELFELFDKNGIAMFQSHPFRGYCIRLNRKYLHGIEIYNGHPEHDSRNGLAEEFAKENNLIGISGSDFHELPGKDTIRGGIYIPETIKTGKGLAKYIKSCSLTLIRN